MIPKERVLRALDLKEPDRVPFIELEIDEDIARRVLGIEKDYEFEQRPLMKTGEPIVRPFIPGSIGKHKLIDFAKKINLDAVGISIQPPVWANIGISTSGREYVEDGLINNREKLEKLKFPDPDDEKLYEPVRKFIDENKSDFALFAHINLGYAPVVQSMGMENFCMSIFDDIDLVSGFLEMYVDWVLKTMEHIKDFDFDFIWAGDDIAHKGGLTISPELFMKIFFPQLKKVAERIELPWIFHSDGDISSVLDDLLSLGMNGIHPVEPGAMDITGIKKDYGKRVCLVGNVDLDKVLSRGNQKETEKEVRNKIKQIGPGGGYIISSSNSITSYVKLENLYAMSEAVLKYGTYPINI